MKTFNDDMFKDINSPEIVEIEIRSDGKVVWVNVDGRCVLRCCQIKNLSVRDARPIVFLDEIEKLSEPHKLKQL